MCRVNCSKLQGEWNGGEEESAGIMEWTSSDLWHRRRNNSEKESLQDSRETSYVGRFEDGGPDEKIEDRAEGGRDEDYEI